MRRAGRPGALQSIRGVPRRRNPSGPRRCIQGESPAPGGSRPLVAQVPRVACSTSRSALVSAASLPLPVEGSLPSQPRMGAFIYSPRALLPAAARTPPRPSPGPARAFYFLRACHVLLPGRLLYSGGVVCRVGRIVSRVRLL